MSLPQITEPTIQHYAAPHIFARGSEYYQQGRVTSLIVRGSTLYAEVEGSEELPYLVLCTFDAGGPTEASCTCPYDWGGWCKHLVAACLCLIYQPEMVEERPPLEQQLADLTHEQLQVVLLNLAERNPALVKTIDHEVEMPCLALTETTPQPSVRIPTSATRPGVIDPQAVRRQVRKSLHSLDYLRSSEAYWQVSAVVDDVRRFLDQAWVLLEKDQGRDALLVLQALTEAYLAEWENLDDSDGEASGFFQELVPAWSEALLSADLDQQERKTWAACLTTWQRELDQYGVDEAFDCAIAAAHDGWDSAPLKQVLQGTITERGAWKGEPPDFADDLTVARLHVLARRERFQEYLYLAQAERQHVAYTTMLVRLQRIQEAIDYGLRFLATPQEVLILATTLFEHGEHEQSLRIAEYGLTLAGSKAALAKWLRERAITLGKTELALSAAEHAFRAEISLDSYQHISRLAGDQWPQRRAALLEYARTTKAPPAEGRVAVFLSEGLADDAIAALEPYAGHELIAKVADAVLHECPAWVIQASLKQAEDIMDNGKAQLYHAAANWLAKARAAYRVLKREAEWRAYVGNLLRVHARKYKLVPLLQALQQ